MPNITGITNNYVTAAQEGVARTLQDTIDDVETGPINFSSLAGYDDGDWVILTLDPTGTKEVIYGQKTGNALENVVRGLEGTASSHNAGVAVYDYITASHWALLKAWLEAEHNSNGTHINGSIDTPMFGQVENLSGDNLDAMTGRYIIGYGNGALNKPSGADDGFLINIPHTTFPSTYNHQEWQGRTDETRWRREMEAGVWSAWRRVEGPKHFPAFWVHRTGATQSVASGATTKITGMTLEQFDNGSNYNNTTARFEVNATGIYALQGGLYREGGTGTKMGIAFFKNGVQLTNTRYMPTTAGWLTVNESVTVNLTSGDYVELYGYSEGGTSTIVGNGGTFFSGHLVMQTA